MEHQRLGTHILGGSGGKSWTPTGLSSSPGRGGPSATLFLHLFPCPRTQSASQARGPSRPPPPSATDEWKRPGGSAPSPHFKGARRTRVRCRSRRDTEKSQPLRGGGAVPSKPALQGCESKRRDCLHGGGGEGAAVASRAGGALGLPGGRDPAQTDEDDCSSQARPGQARRAAPAPPSVSRPPARPAAQSELK